MCSCRETNQSPTVTPCWQESPRGHRGWRITSLAQIAPAHSVACARWEWRGDESLSRRPMERVISPLSAMGAQISSRDGKPPLRITGAALEAIDYKMPVASAQGKSCLL